MPIPKGYEHLFEGLSMGGESPAPSPRSAPITSSTPPSTKGPEQYTHLFSGLNIGETPALPGTAPLMPPATTEQAPQGYPEDVPADIQPAETLTPAQEQAAYLQQLPELGKGGLLSGESKAKIAKVAPLLVVTTDPQEMGDILSSNFSNIGVTQAGPEGPFMATNRETGARVVLNKPGLSQLDVLQTLGLGAAFTPAARLAGGLTRAGVSLATRFGAGAATAGGTQAAIESAQEIGGGQFNEEDIGTAATLGGLFEGAAPPMRELIRRTLGRVTQRGKDVVAARKAGMETEDVLEPFPMPSISKAKPYELEAPIEAAVETAKAGTEATKGLAAATGTAEVKLLPAQKTLLPSQLRKQELLPQLSATSKKAFNELRKQNKAVYDTTVSLLNTIATPEIRETGAAAFRTASQKVRDNLIAARDEAVSPIFNRAYGDAAETGLQIDVAPVMAQIDDLSAGFREGSIIGGLLGKIKKSVTESANTQFKGSNLKPLHNEKREINQIISKFERENGFLDKEIKAKLIQVRQSLVGEMRSASPSYNEAMDSYFTNTKPIERFQESILGGIAEASDLELKKVAGRLFDPTEINPTVLKNAKEMIGNVDPTAWRKILGAELQRRVGGMKEMLDDAIETGAPNIPALLRRSIFGNPERRRVLLAGMDIDQKLNFKWLEETLKRTAAGRKEGSPTIPFSEALKEMRGVPGVIKDAFLQPIQTLQKAGDETLVNRNLGRLSNILLNPEYKIPMRKIRRTNPMSADAARAFGQIMDDAVNMEPYYTENSFESQ